MVSSPGHARSRQSMVLGDINSERSSGLLHNPMAHRYNPIHQTLGFGTTGYDWPPGPTQTPTYRCLQHSPTTLSKGVHGSIGNDNKHVSRVRFLISQWILCELHVIIDSSCMWLFIDKLACLAFDLSFQSCNRIEKRLRPTRDSTCTQTAACLLDILAESSQNTLIRVM